MAKICAVVVCAFSDAGKVFASKKLSLGQLTPLANPAAPNNANFGKHSCSSELNNAANLEEILFALQCMQR